MYKRECHLPAVVSQRVGISSDQEAVLDRRSSDRGHRPKVGIPETKFERW